MPSRSKKDVRYPRVGFSILIGIFTFLGIILAPIGFSETYLGIHFLTGTGGLPHILGSFYTQEGNPGTLEFGAQPTDGYTGAHIIIPGTGAQILSGSFWAQTVGWINLDNIELNLTNTASQIWTLSGYGWNESAGWIDFNGIEYTPTNTHFSGYAWNDGVGWIDMSEASIDLSSSGTLGKVKILGVLGGNNAYSTTYTTETTASALTTSKLINSIEKNVASITRNLPASFVNSTLGSYNYFDVAGGIHDINNFILYENTGSTVAHVDYSEHIRERFVNIGNAHNPVYSTIVIGADVYIDDAVIPQEDGMPRVIIALKNDAGVGGNIYIDGTVTRIKSTLIAEGSLYSGEVGPTGVTTIYNNDPFDLTKIPNRQLYVLGSVISNNTIGGYGADNGITNYCPYNVSPCDNSTAITYDMNRFRDFQGSLPETEKVILRGYEHPVDSALNDIYDAYSIVIEHDIRIISSPPPGLETQ